MTEKPPSSAVANAPKRSSWRPGHRHMVTGDPVRCVDCGTVFGDRWPTDDEKCPGPSRDRCDRCGGVTGHLYPECTTVDGGGLPSPLSPPSAPTEGRSDA
jgi:DNA-directed RNA polymerase subunit N (RpoN/RPB10)